MRAIIIFGLIAVAGAAAAATNFPVSARSILVGTNGVILDPPPEEFFRANSIALNGEVLTNVEERILDLIEQSLDVQLPDALEDYYSKDQSDTRYLMIDSYLGAGQVAVTGAWSFLSGRTVAEVLDSIDRALEPTDGGTGTTVIVVSNAYYTAGVTNASGIGVAFAPQAYSPSGANVQEHLRAIDSRLQYLNAYVSSNGAPLGTQTLASVAISGANTASEGVNETYVLTATLSDGTTTDVSYSAFAQWSVSGSAGASMQTNVLRSGLVTSNTTVSVQGIYSFHGATKQAAKSVLIIDTNPPVLTSVVVVGTNAVDERGSATYRAWALFDSGASNDVSTSDMWGGDAGTVIDGALTAAEVTSNTVATVVAQYAHGSVIKTGTNVVAVRSLDQRLVVTIDYSGVYAAGTLHLDCWANSNMQNFPLQSWTIPNFAAIGTHTITNQLTSQRTGPTWWYAWLDTDNNGILNGVMGPLSGVMPIVRIDEPAGLSSVIPVSLQASSDARLNFTLTDFAPGCHVRQGWAASSIGNSPRSVFVGYNASFNRNVLQTVTLTNRSYICEWDTMIGNYKLGTTNGLFASGTIKAQGPTFVFYIYKANVDGSVDSNVGAYGGNQVWP